MLPVRLLIARRLRPVAVVAGSLAAALILAGCAGGASGATGSFSPQPNFFGNNDPNPQLPNPGIPAPSLGASPPGGSGPGTTPNSSAPSTADPAVVASKLDQPTGLVVLPDGSALVAERTTGRIYRVQADGSRPPELVQTLAGVDGSGDGGLLDLAISPSYAEDGLIYAYLTTATDNRVVHFPLAGAPSVVIGGIPRGRTGNVGRIAFDATGALLTGTGDAGNPALAADPRSLAGKVLRTDDIGKPAPDNPDPSSPVYARGLSEVDGVCVDARSGTRLAVSQDRVLELRPGADYSSATSSTATLPASLAGAGGCALGGGQLLVASATGQALAIAPIGTGNSIGNFQAAVSKKYGRLRTVVLGTDGAIWLTTRNRDGHGTPVPADDRVIRLTSVGGAGSVL
ncbi:MAG TPA: PQQ-dependent sugar dehydrogenase [Jatrophihabitans sp.]|nr:PQQ-dependent sugar dehydrogenase [Jatrophihabitans sp.]